MAGYKRPQPIMLRIQNRVGLRIETESRPLHVSHSEVRRPTGRKIGGMFAEVEGTGRFRRDFFNISVDGETLYGIPANKTSVDKHVRRMRESELAELTLLDEQIRALNLQRRALIETAFKKGHVVTVKELTEKGDAWLKEHGK